MFYIRYNQKDVPGYGMIPSKEVLYGPYQSEQELIEIAERNGIKKFYVLQQTSYYEVEPRVAYKKMG
jgi:hypothetical protein